MLLSLCLSRSTLVLTAPTGVQRVVAVPCSDDSVIAAGSNSKFIFGYASTLEVATSATADHSSTRVALVQFPVPSDADYANLLNAAILELTVAAAPSQDMVMTVIGIPPSVTWAEGAVVVLSLHLCHRPGQLFSFRKAQASSLVALSPPGCCSCFVTSASH